MNKKNREVVGILVVIIFWASVIGGGYYWYHLNQVKKESDYATRVKDAVERDLQYEQTIAPIRVMCETTSTKLTVRNFYQCQLIYSNDGDVLNSVSDTGLPILIHSTSEVLNPDLPSTCDSIVSQLTPFEFYDCMNQLTQFR